MNKGRVIKIISNQYTVLYNNEAINCIAMGKLRKDKSPVVGDFVEFEYLDGVAAIQKVLPRVNHLDRPSIANVDQAIIIMSLIEPDFSSQLVDRLIFLIEYQGINPVIVVTKMDKADVSDEVQAVFDDYKKSGYQIIFTKKNHKDKEIEDLFKDKVSVLTGQSGVGKSSLINTYVPNFEIKTQEISKALGRGKHTTRHSELHEVCGGWVADTPGFSSLDFEQLELMEFVNCIKDFKDAAQSCKFRNCIHQNEPGCSVKEGVDNGEISNIRYKHYLEVLKIIQNKKEKYL